MKCGVEINKCNKYIILFIIYRASAAEAPKVGFAYEKLIIIY